MKNGIISAEYVNLYEFDYIPEGERYPWDAIPIDIKAFHPEGFLHIIYMEEMDVLETTIPLDEFSLEAGKELREAHRNQRIDREEWHTIAMSILKIAQLFRVCLPGTLNDFLTDLEERTIDMWEERRRERGDQGGYDLEEDREDRWSYDNE